MRTMGQRVKKLLGRLPGSQELEVKRTLIEALEWLYAKQPWLFLLKEAMVVTEAPYTTGTVTATINSTALVLVDGVWDTTWVNRRIVISGRGELYSVTINSTTTATLSHAWAGSTGSALSYVMYRDVYTLPSDCDWGRDSFWGYAEESRQVDIIGTYEMKRRKAFSPAAQGRPMCVSRGELQQTVQTALPVAMIEFGPAIPDAAYAINGWYFKKPTLPSADDHYPLWPDDYDELIDQRAEIIWAQSPRHRLSLSHDWMFDHNTLLLECIRRNDGGAELTRIVEIYNGGRPLSRGLSNFDDASGYSPYILGT